MVEQLVYTKKAGGSNPSGCTTDASGFIFCFYVCSSKVASLISHWWEAKVWTLSQETVSYQKVGTRCALAIKALEPHVPGDRVKSVLWEAKFRAVSVDLLTEAHNLIGQATYRRSARPSEAPDVVDCGSLLKWLYGLRGVWLERDFFAWPSLGKPVPVADLGEGDLIFTTDNGTGADIGHVAMATDSRSAVHAVNAGVEVVSFDELFEKRTLCAIRRIVPKQTPVVTFELPPEAARDIETSNDMLWVVRHKLGMRE